MRITDTDVYYFREIENVFKTEDYNELVDVLYHYMKAYVNGLTMDVCLFRDECENLINVSNHDDIIEIIKMYIGR